MSHLLLWDSIWAATCKNKEKIIQILIKWRTSGEQAENKRKTSEEQAKNIRRTSGEQAENKWRISNPTHLPLAQSAPALVIDDSHDFSRALMGKVKEVFVIQNLPFLLSKDGFPNLKLTYLGGLWILIEAGSLELKEKLSKHVGVGSWFNSLKPAYDSDCSSKEEHFTDDEGRVSREKLNSHIKGVNSEIDRVFESSCMHGEYLVHDYVSNIQSPGEKTFEDPFNIYYILNLSTLTKGDENEANSIQDCPNEVRIKDEISSHQSQYYFVAIMGTWIPTSTKLLIVSIYAPQELLEKCLIEIPLGSYSFTWARKSATKMSKLDRFLISEGLMALFAHLSALCFDRHLSDHCPILMREINLDYGPTPFWLFHSWFQIDGLIILLEKHGKMQRTERMLINLKQKNKLSDIDKKPDQGGYNDETLNERSKLVNELYDLESLEDLEITQKVKVRWSIEGDENTKYCQAEEMECIVSYDEIKQAVWDYGTNKFPDPDGFSFEFFHFEKVFDSVRWDYLDDVLKSFGFGDKWCSWINGCLNSAIGDLELKAQYPRLYALELHNDISVAEKKRDSSLALSFRCPLRGWAGEEQYSYLLSRVDEVSLPYMLDRWVWTFDSLGDFSVKSVRILIDDMLLQKKVVHTRWVNVVLLKVNILAWRLWLDKLLTGFNLSLRGVEISCTLCPLCSVSVESTLHLFFSCSLAQ
ncbi:RNA-directed DNA polymerase, eukaryota [Tanacetum coccineum]